MSEQRKSGFGVGFSKEVDSILAAGAMGVIFPHEVRRNLELAGMELDGEIEMPKFPTPQLEEYDIDVGLDDPDLIDDEEENDPDA